VNNPIPENSGKTQLMLQTVEMQFQHGRNPYTRGNSWLRTSQDGARKNKSSERVEDSDKD